MNFNELPKKLQDMLNAMKKARPEIEHVEIMTPEDFEKLKDSIPNLSDKLPRLAFNNGAVAFLYTGFFPTIPSLMMPNQKAVDELFVHPRWNLNIFKHIGWRPGTTKKVLNKGDRLVVALHHLKGLTVVGYYVAGMRKMQDNSVVVRCEIAGGLSFPFRDYAKEWDELPFEELFTLDNPFAIKAEEADWAAGLEDFEKYAEWEAPIGKDYFKG